MQVNYYRISILYFILTALLLSYFIFSGQSLRLDESQSLWQTSFSTGRLLEIVASDVHVPFYHSILHYWQIFLGNEVAVARILSLIFFVLTIPAVYLLGKITYGEKIGIFAALLVTISPFLNWYGNEIRMYSLFVFLTVLNQYFFVRLYKNRKEGALIWLLYSMTAILGSFTHYFFLFQILAQAMFYFSHKNLFNAKSFKRFAIIISILLVVMGGWFYYVFSLDNIGFSRPKLDEPTTYNLFDTMSQFIFGFQSDHFNALIIALWPLSVLLAFLTLGKNTKISHDTFYLFISILIPITFSFIISITIQPLYLTRYLIFTIPSLYLFLGWVFSTYPPRAGQVARIAIAAVMVLTLFDQTISANLAIKEDFRTAADYLNRETNLRDVIIISPPFTIYPLEYYYRGPATITTLPKWNRFASGAIPEFSEEKMAGEIKGLKSTYDKGWLLLSYDQGYEQEVKFYFDTNFERLETHELSPGITLHAYRFNYNRDPLTQIR